MVSLTHNDQKSCNKPEILKNNQSTETFSNSSRQWIELTTFHTEENPSTSYILQSDIIFNTTCFSSLSQKNSNPKNSTVIKWGSNSSVTLTVAQQIKTFIESIPFYIDDEEKIVITPEGTYEGPLTNAKPKGIGKVTVPSGTYNGDLDSLPNGYGTIKTKLNTISSAFVDGVPQGRGRESFVNYKAVSKFVKNQTLDLQQIGNLAQNNIYEGDFKNGIKEGSGIYSLMSRGSQFGALIYSGQWKRNQFHGYGIYNSLTDGYTYQGEFANGSISGSGVCTWKNGTVRQGLWKDNKLIS